jgi:hypothetical protein
MRHAQLIYREPQRAEPYAITPSHRNSMVLGVNDGVHSIRPAASASLRSNGEAQTVREHGSRSR